MKKSARGAVTVEYVIAYSLLLLPVTFAIIFTAQLLWVWQSVVDFTRAGARYATTHCWQADGDNVRQFMQQNVPLMFDREQFQGGPAEFQIEYTARNAETGQLEEFTCEQGDCSANCVPDMVKVSIINYEFRPFITSYLGLPPVTLPDFHTSLPMESAGCQPDLEECFP